MKKFIVLLFTLLIMTRCCIRDSRIHTSTHQHIMDSTVALIDEDGHTSCAGTWIDATHVLTAGHCVVDRSDPLALETKPKKKQAIAFREDVPRTLKGEPSILYVGEVVKFDEGMDLALISLPMVPPHCWSQVSSDDAKLGEELRIVGHPVGLQWTFMKGTANGLRDMPQEGVRLQVVAPIFFGSSGGGAFNEDGDLVGVASFIMRAPNEGFFVPASIIQKFVRSGGA